MRAIRWSIAVLLAIVGAWLATWHLWLAAAWWVAAAVAVARAWWRGWLGLLPVGALLVPWALLGYVARMDTLAARVARGGPDALGFFDCVAVYGLNLVMAAGGLVSGFPEIAAETLSLTVPHGSPVVRVPSDFPLRSPRIQRLIERHGRREAVRQRVSWTYTDPDDSLRVALALNPADVVLTRRDGRLQVEATVPVSYPPRSRLVLAAAGPFEIVFEEGLFHALQQRGWLHPYRLTYVASVPDGAPLPAPAEAWSVQLARAISPWTP